MSEESQVLRHGAAFERSWPLPTWNFRMPSLSMAVLFVIVGFLVLTPLALMIVNSFQIARPGQSIVWGLEGWAKAFSTPGIIKAMGNTFTSRSRDRQSASPWVVSSRGSSPGPICP